jgi:hypothetical protein
LTVVRRFMMHDSIITITRAWEGLSPARCAREPQCQSRSERRNLHRVEPTAACADAKRSTCGPYSKPAFSRTRSQPESFREVPHRRCGTGPAERPGTDPPRSTIPPPTPPLGALFVSLPDYAEQQWYLGRALRAGGGQSYEPLAVYLAQRIQSAGAKGLQSEEP